MGGKESQERPSTFKTGQSRALPFAHTTNTCVANPPYSAFQTNHPYHEPCTTPTTSEFKTAPHEYPRRARPTLLLTKHATLFNATHPSCYHST